MSETNSKLTRTVRRVKITDTYSTENWRDCRNKTGTELYSHNGYHAIVLNDEDFARAFYHTRFKFIDKDASGAALCDYLFVQAPRRLIYCTSCGEVRSVFKEMARLLQIEEVEGER